MNPQPDNRVRDSLISAGAFAIAAIACFLLPNCTFFGIVLVLLGAVYCLCLATGMEPNADPTSTWHHLRSTLQRLGPGPGAVGTAPPPFVSGYGVQPPPPPMPMPMPMPDATPPPAITPTAVHQPPPEVATPQQPDTGTLSASPAPEANAMVPPEQAPEPGISAVPPETLRPADIPTPTVRLDNAGPPNALSPPPPAYHPVSPPPIPPPAPTPTRRRAILIGAIAFVSVAAIAVAATVTAVLFSRNDDGGSGGTSYAAGTLHSAYPTVPSAAFALTPDQLQTNSFTRPNYLIGGEESTGYLRSDRYIITGVAGGGLVAVDPTTGRVAWQQLSLRDIHCSDVFDDQTMGCATDFGLYLLSADTGKVIANLPSGYRSVQKFGDKYAYVGQTGDTATLSLGTRTDPTKYWTRSQTIPGGTRSFLAVSDKIVAYSDGSATGGWSMAYNESGEKIGQTSDYGAFLGDDGWVTQPGDSSVVYGSDGKQRYLSPPTPQQPRLYAPAPGISVAFTRNSAIDPATGRVLWQRPLAPAPSEYDQGPVAVVGSIAILRSQDSPDTAGVDIRTGRVIWQQQFDAFPYDLTTDGRRLIGVAGDDGKTLFAIDVATGTRTWQVSLPDVGDYPKAIAVGDQLAVVGSQAVVGFHPTGGSAVLYDSASATTPGGNSGSAVTPCDKPATVTPVNFQVSDQSLVVTLRFTAACSSGDVLSNSAYTVTISDQSSVIATSQFDLSSTPIALPRNSTNATRDFTFPSGSYFRLPSSLAGGSGSSTSVNASGETASCSGTGTDSVAAGQQVDPSSTSASDPIVGSATTVAPPGLDPTANAINALRAQADADRPLVQQQYTDRWLAQISAKQVRNPPMVVPDVDDRTMVAWTPQEILRQHLALRARYPEVRLIFSDDWRSFDLRGWWITVAQPNVLDAEGANAWCDSKAIPPNQCFAKLVSNTRGSAGTTEYRR